MNFRENSKKRIEEILKISQFNINYNLIEKSVVTDRLRRLSYRAGLDEEEIINNFSEINSDIFAKYNPIKILGRGEHGTAFETEDGHVLKLFGNIGNLAFYERMFNEGFKDNIYGKEYLLKVIDYGPLRMPKKIIDLYTEHWDFTAGWAVMEKLDTMESYEDLHPRLRDTVDEIIYFTTMMIRQYAEEKRSLYQSEIGFRQNMQNDPHLKRRIDALAHHIKKEVYRYSMYTDVLDEIPEEKFGEDDVFRIIKATILAVLYGGADAQEQNIGFRDKQPVYFDAVNPEIEETEYAKEKFPEYLYEAQEPITVEELKSNAKIKNPIKQNYDYEGNFLDKIRKRLKKKKKRKLRKKALNSLLNGNEVIGLGDAGEEALQVQRKLKDKGYLPAQGVSGLFDQESDKALRQYQQDNDLIEDGIAGEWVAGKMTNQIPIATPEPVRSLLHNNKDIAPMAGKIGVSPLFLKALLDVSEHNPDIYMEAWFKSNPKAVAAVNDLNFEVFAEYYFGEHYVNKGIAEKLRNAFEKASESNPEFKMK